MTRDQITATAAIIRETVSARQYADILGLPVNRAGFTNCPFHNGDKGASLRLYEGNKGWHCFGCGQSGDVIELAKRFYNLKYPQAVERIAEQTGVGLPVTGKTGRNGRNAETSRVLEWVKTQERQRKREEIVKRAIETKYWEAFDQWHAADQLVQELAEQEKQNPEAGFSAEFAQALLRRQDLEANLDYLIIWRDELC